MRRRQVEGRAHQGPCWRPPLARPPLSATEALSTSTPGGGTLGHNQRSSLRSFPRRVPPPSRHMVKNRQERRVCLTQRSTPDHAVVILRRSSVFSKLLIPSGHSPAAWPVNWFVRPSRSFPCQASGKQLDLFNIQFWRNPWSNH
jgi:hypothetical protein